MRTVLRTLLIALIFIAGIAVGWFWHAWSVAQATGVPAPRIVAAPVAGEPVAGKLAIPVAGVQPAQLVDTFADARANGGRAHDAIDILAPRGTAVIAAAPGRVEKLLASTEGGNTVYVRSSDGRTIHYYAHLDAYAPGLSEGATVLRGAPLGTVGSTGNADPAAPHLHFAIWQTEPQRPWWEPATAIDPYPLLTQP